MPVLHLLTLRLRLIIFSIFFAITLIAAYLFHLQINHMQRFYAMGINNFLRHEKIISPRGNIIDVTGELLATSTPHYTLSWQGTSNRSLSRHQQNIFSMLTTLFTLPSDILRLIEMAEKLGSRIILVKDVPFEQLGKLIEQFPNEKNLLLEKNFKRSYPHRDLACHVVGYLGLDSDAQGKMGLELICQKSLRGQPGKVVKIINAIGHHIQAHQATTGLAGQTLQTTLNASLQRYAEELFPPDFEGSCLLMDATGALEVIVSRPSFDPTMFLKPLTISQWKDLQEKQRFINRAFGACYPPASLFKLISLAAALETGIMSKDMRWHCIGHTTFKGRDYHCNDKKCHGVLSTEQALAHSCNMPFYEIGKKIKIDTLAQYAHRCGLGTKTGIIFPEKAGLVPTVAWKRRVKHEPWWPGETLSAAIGQSSLLVTPIQIATMLNALCTGYRVRPRILTQELVVQEPLELKKETQSFLKQCLASVITVGTGSSLKRLPHFKLAGKSGTAQVQGLDKKVLSRANLPHGYFAGHFQYKNEKPYTLVIFVEHAGSSSIAIRYAREFLKKYAHYIERRG